MKNTVPASKRSHPFMSIHLSILEMRTNPNTRDVKDLLRHDPIPTAMFGKNIKYDITWYILLKARKKMHTMVNPLKIVFLY